MLRSLCAVTFLAFTNALHAAQPADHVANAVKQQQALKRYGQLPLSFTANQGQYDSKIAFQTRGSGYSISLTHRDAVFNLDRPAIQNSHTSPLLPPRPTDGRESDAAKVRMQFVGAAENLSATGMDELPGTASFLIGPDPSRWHTSVPTYSKVKYSGLYPGIDLVYYGNQKQLEFDFILQPNANPGDVRLRFESERLGRQVLRRIDRAGDLIIGEAGKEIRLPKPVVYQSIAAVGQPPEKRIVDAGYVLSGTNEVCFRIGAYDRKQPLVIDPTVAYAALIGGSGADVANRIVVDSTGDAYIAGSTSSVDFPTTRSAFQLSGLPSSTYAFITKLNAAGTALIFSTYLGGTQGTSSFATGIAVDALGDSFLTGNTNSPAFPVTPGAFQAGAASIASGALFITKLNPFGTGLLYSSLVGAATANPSSRSISARGIAIDSTGDAYVAGTTTSLAYPTTPGSFQSSPGVYSGINFASAFVTKLNAEGSALVYSSYLPGTETEVGVAVDPSGSAYLAGLVNDSRYFPKTPGVVATSGTIYITKFNPAGSALAYSTNLPSHLATPTAMALDSTGSVYVTGTLGSLCNNDLRDEPFLCAGGTNLPGTVYINPGVYQTVTDGFGTFLSKFNPAGSAVVYSTYLGTQVPITGGNGGFPYQYFDYTARPTALAVDGQGHAYVSGVTSSADFPLTSGAFQTTLGNGAFFSEFNPTGTDLLFSTFLAGGVAVHGLASDLSGNVYLAGSSPSTLPTTPGAYSHPGSGGLSDAFVTKITQPAAGIVSQSISFAPLANQTYGVGSISLNATASSGLPVKFRVSSGPATVQGSRLVITGAGMVIVTALQEGNSQYAEAAPVSRAVIVGKAVLKVTADNLVRSVGVSYPAFTYTLTGFLGSDTALTAVGGGVTLTTSATTSSAPGPYPITFADEALTSANYTFVYVSGTLTVAAVQCQAISAYVNGFTPGGLSLNNGAVANYGYLQLTDLGKFEARSAFYMVPVRIDGFASDFTFLIDNPQADGFTFTVQSNNAQIYGHSGGDLGYTGIPHSAAIKFDIHNNQGEGPDSMGFVQDGVAPTLPAVNLAPLGIDLHSEHAFHVHIGYAKPSVTVKLTDLQTGVSTTQTFPADLSTTVGATAYAGFTAGTGESTSFQIIEDWSFSGGPGCNVVGSMP